MSQDQHRTALGPGYRLHEYHIEKVLGHGGFGITYLATDTHLQKKVAVKEFLPNDVAVRIDGSSVQAKSQEDQETFEWGLERFTQEAQTLARFRHPNIIQINRYFEENNTAYFVMDYEDGDSLKGILDRAGSLSQSELEEILFPLLGGLQAVHDAGVLHRDIKPGNIYIRQTGDPVLLDFGAARQALGSKSRSLTSIFTPGYAPFEQYHTDGEQGPWTDIYALAAVLYRGVTASAPPEAPSRVRKDPLVPAKQAGKGKYTSEFLDAIDQGLGLYAEDRPQDIATWRDAFLGETKAGPSRPPSRPPSSRPGPKRPKSDDKGATGPASVRPPSQRPALAARAAPADDERKSGVGRLVFAGGLGVLAIGAAVAAFVISQGGDGTGTGNGGTSIASTGSTGTTPIGAQTDPPAHRCDTLAGDPWHPKRKHAGTQLGSINSGAIEACKEGHGAHPRAPRIMAHYARALFKAGRHTEAVAMARKAADAGDASGAFHLAVAHHHGIGTSKDLITARRWYATAAEKAHALAQLHLGLMEVSGVGGQKDPQTGARRVREAADKGVIRAQWRVGALYKSGDGVAKNPTEAASWFKRAADKGYPPAQTDLGLAYLSGAGVTKNHAIGVNWLRKAAVQRDGRALYHLGRKSYYGDGTTKDRDLARRFFELSATNGNARGQNALGVIFYTGAGVTQNRATAARWFRRAADQGYAVSQRFLGISYLQGHGLTQNYVEAYFWLSLAVKRGDTVSKSHQERAVAQITSEQRAAVDQRVARWQPKQS